MGERKLIKTFGFDGGKVLESSFNSRAEHSSESKFKTENRYRTSIGWTLGKRLRFQYFFYPPNSKLQFLHPKLKTIKNSDFYSFAEILAFE